MHDHARAAALGELSRFRREFHASSTARSDALFELTDAVLCAEGAGHLAGGSDPGGRAPPRTRGDV
ncbi:MAG: hypothetical protein AVDCRST_MAG66-3781 [uncultured Pseudonocardia sp.]|uniref:Uncharacterized protein n=1 Tax=uncultured Pseudonocardia sp. TaxID=211455 RepID=A0A6J4QA77_9PSEU|nr:MAG: hypothetical protein AVDCRST_MAG66-3781 [uncultured Pseudonocardia sp.]